MQRDTDSPHADDGGLRECRSLLENYGNHHEWCAAHPLSAPNGPCTCGFADILAATPEPAPAVPAKPFCTRCGAGLSHYEMTAHRGLCCGCRERTPEPARLCLDVDVEGLAQVLAGYRGAHALDAPAIAAAYQRGWRDGEGQVNYERTHGDGEPKHDP